MNTIKVVMVSAINKMLVVIPMDFETRSRRNFTYVLWMLGSALIPVGLSFAFGSVLQFIFLGLGVGLFILSRAISATIQAR